MRLIFALFQMPFWVYLAAAGGLFYLGELSHRDTLAQNQEMQRALAGQPPETVQLAEFSRADDIGLADEVSVVGVINPDYNYELTRKRKGLNKTRFMYVLFDSADAKDSKLARGAVVLSEDEKDKFVNDYYEKNSEIGISESGFVSLITFNGRARNSSDLSSLVNDAFDEQNLTKSEDFIYVEPFLEGRAAGLTPAVSADEMRNIIRGVGLGAALIGLFKFALRRRRKAAGAENDAPAEPEMPSPVMAPVMAPVTANADHAAQQPEAGPEPVSGTLWGRIPLSVKALALIGVAAFLIYTGQMTYALVYAAIVALIALQMFAVRKTRNVIAGGLSRLGVGKSREEKADDALLAGVQAAARVPTKPDRTASPEPMQEMPQKAEKTKRGFGLKLPGLGRKADDGEEEAALTNPVVPAVAETTSKRGFKLPLPGFLRKSDSADEMPTRPKPAVRTARQKDAFQSATLFTPSEEDEKLGLGEKIQLLLARLTPAEREPKAFAGRPDPFEKLASDAQRFSAR